MRENSAEKLLIGCILLFNLFTIILKLGNRDKSVSSEAAVQFENNMPRYGQNIQKLLNIKSDLPDSTHIFSLNGNYNVILFVSPINQRHLRTTYYLAELLTAYPAINVNAVTAGDLDCETIMSSDIVSHLNLIIDDDFKLYKVFRVDPKYGAFVVTDHVGMIRFSLPWIPNNQIIRQLFDKMAKGSLG